MTIFIIILVLVIITLSYIVYNLYTKNTKLQDIGNELSEEVIKRDNWLIQLYNEIITIDTELNRIDEKGAFKSDDEVGFFFTTVLNMRDKLKTFTDIIQKQ